MAKAIRTGGLRSVYQPIVHLDDGVVVAHEALLRGPPGSAIEGAGPLFAAGAREGLSGELEWQGVACGIMGALHAGLDARSTLLINVEALSAGQARAPDQLAMMDRAWKDLRVILEITERNLMVKPSALLAAAEYVREHGGGIALDDVGVDNQDALAMLPFLRPELIKLDLQLIQGRPDADVGRIVAAIAEHVERVGGTVLAEGIETAAQLHHALSMGATLGQGFLFGRPGPLTTVPVDTLQAIPTLPAHRPTGDTPYGIVTRHREARIAPKRSILAMSRFLESRVASAQTPPVVLSTLQQVTHLTPATIGRYVRMVTHTALVALFGVDLPPHPGPGVRGVGLAVGEDLAAEWSVIVTGPHVRAALVARDLGDDGPDLDRRFSFVLTHDPDLVEDAARSLLVRVPEA